MDQDVVGENERDADGRGADVGGENDLDVDTEDVGLPCLS